MLRFAVTASLLILFAGASAPGQTVSLPAAPAVGEVTDFCFYIWTDTHFTGQPIHGGVHDQAVDLMNGLPGTEGPPAFGAIPPAAFVLHAGDILNHGDPNQWKNEVNGTDDDFMTCISRLFLPVFEVRGNHDHDADQVYVRDRIIERHGGIYYGFDYGGIHFIGLDVTKRAPETGDEQLQWLTYELARYSPEVPVVVWQHLPVTGDMTWYPLYEVLNDYNVILLVYGHTHHYGRSVWNFGGVDLWDGGHNRFCIDMDSPSVLSVVKFEGSRMRALPYLTCEQRWDTAHFLDKMIAGRGTPTPTPTGPTRTPTLTPTPTVTRTPTVTYTQTFTATPSATPVIADDFLLAFAGERVEPADLVSPYTQGRYQAISVPDGEQVHRVEFRMSSGTHTQATAVFRVYLVGGVPGDGRSPEGRILLQESPPTAVGPALDYYGFTLDPPLGRGRYYACVEVTAVEGGGTGWALERWTGEYDDTWDRGASGSFVLRADRDYALRAWLTAPSMTPSPTPLPARHGAVSLY